MQARTGGKLVAVFVSFGIDGTPLMFTTKNARAKDYTLMSLLEGTDSVSREAMSTEQRPALIRTDGTVIEVGSWIPTCSVFSKDTFGAPTLEMRVAVAES